MAYVYATETNPVAQGGDEDDFLYGIGSYSDLRGGSGNDFLKPSGGGTQSNTDGPIDGGSGFDRISYFNEVNGVVVDLRITTAQDTGRGRHTIINVENLSGTRFNDVLIGDEGSNILWGSTGGDDRLIGNGGDDFLAIGPGSHSIEGGDGTDTLGVLELSGLTEGLVIALTSQMIQQDTGEGTATISSIENLSGSTFGDHFTGDAKSNTLAGGNGSDVLLGGDGDDMLSGDGFMSMGGGGGSGPIVLELLDADYSGNDMLDGGGGDDRLYGGFGDDNIRGGDGVDEAVFSGVAAASQIEFDDDGTPYVYGADGFDELDSIERVSFADLLLTIAEVTPVGLLYDRLLGRNASASELGFWAGEITAGRATLASLRSTLVDDPAGRVNIADEVAELYVDYLGREPSGAEQSFWYGQVREGVEFAQIRAAIVTDPAGQAVTSARVRALYTEYIGRPASADEVAFWIDEIVRSSDLEDVREVLLSDPAGRANTLVRITTIYNDLLGRAPSADELIYWANVDLEDFEFADVRSAVLSTPEGQSRAMDSISTSYDDHLNRMPTTEELNYWAGQVYDGLTLVQVDNLLAVVELYNDYIGREPDPAEFAFWRGQLQNGTALEQVRLALFDDPTGQATVAALVDTLYVEFLGRSAAASEIAFWMAQVRLGTEDEVIQAVLVGTPEGQANAVARITALYGEILGREPAGNELAYWSNQVANDVSFSEVREILVSDPSGQAHLVRAIDAVYRDYGGRSASAGELAVWLGQVRDGSTIADVRDAVLDDVLGSTFTTGALSSLYQDLFGRIASADEQRIWSGLFRDGATLDTARSALTFDEGSMGRVDKEVGTVGADTFVFDAGSRHLAISDFDATADRIDLRGLGFGGYNPLDPVRTREITTLDGGTDLLITLDANHDILLRNINYTSLGIEDFLL